LTTSASLLIASGVSIPTVAARLGHATPAITTRIYAHAIRGTDEQAAQEMQRILAK
jgi:integrase